MKNSSNWFHKHHTSQMNLYILQEKKFYFPWCYTTSVGSFSLFFYSFVSSLCFSIPFLFSCLLPYIDTSFVFISTAILSPTEFSTIFFSPLSATEFWLLGVFALFRQSHMHSMRQGLGGSPLINAEVKIFILLTYSERFPEVLNTNWK